MTQHFYTPTKQIVQMIKPVVRKERLAICLYDLPAIHPKILSHTVKGGRVSSKKEDVIWVDQKRRDETACPFTCTLLESAIICDVLRAESRQVGNKPIRIYLQRSKVWRKLPQHAVLTKLKDGKTILNPDWFPEKTKPFEFDIPIFEIPTFGNG